MLIRQQRLFAVLSAVLAETEKLVSEPAIWDCLSRAIKTVAASPAPVGNHQCLIHRDAVLRSGYQGLAGLTFAVRDALAAGHAGVFASVLPPDAVQALSARIAPAKPRNLTREWFDRNLTSRMIDRLVNAVVFKLPEDRAEVASCTNWCIANWCAKDSFHEILAAGNKLEIPALATFIRRTMSSVIRKRGVDAHCRVFHGARTAAERDKGHNLNTANPERVFQTVVTNQDGPGGVRVDYLDPHADTAIEPDIDWAEYGSAILEAVSPNGGARRAEILRAVLAGKDRQDLMREFNLSQNRVGHLTTEIRDMLQLGADLNRQALVLRNLLDAEPWSSQKELVAESGMEPKVVKVTLRYMVRLGLVKASEDKTCYALTPTGFGAVDGLLGPSNGAF